LPPTSDTSRKKLTSRLNMLKIIANCRKGVYTAMLLSVYRVLIKTVLTYSAPALLMASPTSIERLEIIQRAALRIALGLPRPTPTALIYAEANEPPIKMEVKKVTANYLIRAATRPEPTPIIRQVQDSLQKDPRVFPPVTWALKAATIQKDFNIPAIHPPLVQPKPPWVQPSFQVYISQEHSKKNDPLAALINTNSRIQEFSNPQTRVWYTDGSQHATGNTGWAAYSPEETCIKGRLPDFTPITLAELTDLLETLRWFRTHPTHHRRIVIHINSMAALLVLQRHSPSSYPEAAQQVWDEAELLNQIGIHTIFHWVPSHIGVLGNEEADTLANAATALDTMQTCEQTTGALGRHIPTKIKKLADTLFRNYYTTSTGSWYSSTTLPDYKILPSRFIDTQLRLLRCHAYTRSFSSSDRHAICNQCQADHFHPTHYLIGCPALPTIRRKIKDHLLPLHHTLPQEDQAKFILRRSAISHKTIYPLLVRLPYSLQ
jgi:ribonuclease HI